MHLKWEALHAAIVHRFLLQMPGSFFSSKFRVQSRSEFRVVQSPKFKVIEDINFLISYFLFLISYSLFLIPYFLYLISYLITDHTLKAPHPGSDIVCGRSLKAL